MTDRFMRAWRVLLGDDGRLELIEARLHMARALADLEDALERETVLIEEHRELHGRLDRIAAIALNTAGHA
jgi:hypothetical protein